jgi:NAD(P)-dependent dehydrogenase (short-subunit alcohol dehydrogenase family)
MGRFDGRVALITGRACGQGRSRAIALAREGADVALCAIAAQLPGVAYPLSTPDDLGETARRGEKEGHRSITEVLDVRDLDALQRFVATTVDQLGSIDLAIANAAISTTGVGIDLT